MAKINGIAKQARLDAYVNMLEQKLASRIIHTKKPKFADLVSSKGKPMDSLNGSILLERDVREDGSLKGVVSVNIHDLAAMLPDLKADTHDKSGWKKHLDKFKAEGLEDILEAVADPQPEEYELSAMEELKTLDISTMSDFEAKQKLIALQRENRE